MLLIILKAAMLTSNSINNCIYKERYYFFIVNIQLSTLDNIRG